jgi:hypothetical protein
VSGAHLGVRGLAHVPCVSLQCYVEPRWTHKPVVVGHQVERVLALGNCRANIDATIIGYRDRAKAPRRDTRHFAREISNMGQITGTFSDGERVVFRDVPISIQPTHPSSGISAWRGRFEVPQSATPPHAGQSYLLEVSDGRSGQIHIMRLAFGKDQVHQVMFQTDGPFGYASNPLI